MEAKQRRCFAGFSGPLLTLLFALSPAVAEPAGAETISGHEVRKLDKGMPCLLTLRTGETWNTSLSLSYYKDVWSLDFDIDNRASVFSRFFDNLDFRDEAAFSAAFKGVRIGDVTFDFHNAELFEVQRKDVNEKTFASFDIAERHNVARVLEAMPADQLEIPGLLKLEGVSEALHEFRSCAYPALGLFEGQSVTIDHLAELRMIFERSFEPWVSRMARAEHCRMGTFDRQGVMEVIDAAADAFFPGNLNMRKRSEYRKDLSGRIPLAELDGMLDARTDGCLLAGVLANASRMPIDGAIEAARSVD